MAVDQAKLDVWFEYHRPRDDQIEAYQIIRKAGKQFAEAILAHTPTSADQSHAIRHIREAVMNANASVACGGI